MLSLQRQVHANFPAEVFQAILHLVRAISCAAFLLPLAALTQDSGSHPPGGALRTDKVDLPTPINQPPDANAQMRMLAGQNKETGFSAANTQRRKHIAEDADRLLSLASELNSEIHHSGRDVSTTELIRRVDAIEKLAHGVKDHMKSVVRLD